MCTCAYCHKSFTPRPQVKNPRACSTRDCQKKRQRDNEKAWRINNKGLYGRDYHNSQKQSRIREIRSKSASILRALKIGYDFLGGNLDWVHFEVKVFQFFVSLGLRRLNKLWLE